MLRITKFTRYTVYVAICFLIAQLHDLANWLELPSYIHTLQGRGGTAVVSTHVIYFLVSHHLLPL